MRPWLSVLGLYKYDNTIFDKLTLPLKAELRQDLDLIEPAELDKNLLIGKILMDLGELSLIYTDPDILKDMIEIWGDVNHDNFLALWETLLYKYNPIWNKDGTITETGSSTKSGTSSSTGSGSITDSGTHSDTWSEKTVTDSDEGITTTASESSTTSGQSSETKTHSVTGFDTNSYSPDTQDSTSGTSSGTGSVTQNSTTHDALDSEVNVTGSKSGTTGNTRTLSDTRSGTTGETGSNSVTRVEQGNIGVTTTQQMIREQREIVLFNLYQFMTESFKQNFCLMVW